MVSQKMAVEKLERVQKRATKLIPEISKKLYREQLHVLNLPTDDTLLTLKNVAAVRVTVDLW